MFDVFGVSSPSLLWPTFSCMESFSKVSQAKLFQVTHLSRNVKGREGKDGSNEGVLHRHGMIPVFTPLELSLVNVLGSGQHGQQWGRVGMGLLRRDLPTLYHSAPQDLHHGL